jgi:nitrilase
VFLDREATIDKAARLVAETAGQGAALVVFPETFVPTYPDWVWRVPAWEDAEFVGRLYDQSVAVPSAAVDGLAAIAHENGVWLAMGVKEIDGGTL